MESVLIMKKLISFLCVFILLFACLNFKNEIKATDDSVVPITSNLLENYDIDTNENNINKWSGFQQGGCYVASFGKDSNKSIGYYGRTAEWHSPYIDIYDVIKENEAGRYVVTFWLYGTEITDSDMNARVLIRGDENSFITQYGSNTYAVLGRQYVAKKEIDGRMWYKNVRGF